MERLVYELKYFDETTEHLDIEGITLCAGSRLSVDGVPGVFWRNDKLDVGWYVSIRTNDYVRAREVVSEK